MIEVEINKDIREIEPKLILFLTTRQTVCCLIGVGIGVTVGLIVPGDLMTKVIIGAICASPAIIFGWVKFMGIPLEKALPMIFNVLFNPQKRKYISKTDFDYLNEKETIKKTKISKEHKALK